MDPRDSNHNGGLSVKSFIGILSAALLLGLRATEAQAPAIGVDLHLHPFNVWAVLGIDSQDSRVEKYAAVAGSLALELKAQRVGKHTGGLYDSGGRGWVAMPTAEGEQVLKPGEWNDLEVSAHSAHIVTQLNGTKLVNFADSSPHFTDGVIGLQIHTGGGVKMRWKDIYINQR